MNISIIGGLGHIGLPISCLFQVNDNNVTIIDTDKESIENTKNGKPSFYEPGLTDILNQALSKGLKITDEIKFFFIGTLLPIGRNIKFIWIIV